MRNPKALVRLGGSAAAKASRVAAASAQAYGYGNATHRIYGTGLKALGDTLSATDAAQQQGAIGKITNFLAVGSNIAGEMANGIGAFSAAGVLAGGAGQALNAYKPIANVTEKVALWAKSPTAFWSNPAKWAAKKYVSGALKEGLMFGTIENIQNLAHGQGPTLDPFAYAGMKTSLAVRLAGEPIANALANRYSSTYRAIVNHGDFGKALQDEIDKVLADPESVKAFRENTKDDAEALGLPVGLADDAYVRAIMSARFKATGSDIIAQDYFNALDSKFDWQGSTGEQLREKLQTYTSEQRAKAKMGVLRQYLSHGGAFDFESIFQDPDLSGEQCAELISQYTAAEWMNMRGPMALTDWRDKTRLRHAMRSNDNMHEAVVEYGRRASVEAANGNSSSSPDNDLIDTAIGELDKNEQQRMFADAVYGSSPEQLAALSTTPGSPVTERTFQAVEPMIKDRMATDRNFAADYTISMCKNIDAGANMSEEAMDRGVKLVQEVGVDNLIAATDPDRAMTLYRVMGSSEGREKLKELGAQGEALMNRFKEVMPAYTLNAAMRDPLKNIPALAGLWAQSKGFGGIADIVSSPFVFYSMAALLLFGGFTLFRGLSSGSDDTDASGLMTLRKRQQESFLDDLTART